MDKRTLTLVIEIEDKEAAEWIYDNFLSRSSTLKTGITVNTICNGDQLKMIDVFINGLTEKLDLDFYDVAIKDFIDEFNWHPEVSKKNDCKYGKTIGN
jgi:hypothetical protein